MSTGAATQSAFKPSVSAFAQSGYVMAPELIEPPLTDFLWSYMRTKVVAGQLKRDRFIESRAQNLYGDHTFEGLLEFLRPRIEVRTGLSLSPTYSFIRYYTNGAVLPRHRDREACEISVTLNLGQVPDTPWPILVEGFTGEYAAVLTPGDALIYRGSECFHRRDAFPGTGLGQAFLHYVDRDGPHAAQRFDERKELMREPVRGRDHSNNAP